MPEGLHEIRVGFELRQFTVVRHDVLPVEGHYREYVASGVDPYARNLFRRRVPCRSCFGYGMDLVRAAGRVIGVVAEYDLVPVSCGFLEVQDNVQKFMQQGGHLLLVLHFVLVECAVRVCKEGVTVSCTEAVQPGKDIRIVLKAQDVCFVCIAGACVNEELYSVRPARAEGEGSILRLYAYVVHMRVQLFAIIQYFLAVPYHDVPPLNSMGCFGVLRKPGSAPKCLMAAGFYCFYLSYAVKLYTQKVKTSNRYRRALDGPL